MLCSIWGCGTVSSNLIVMEMDVISTRLHVSSLSRAVMPDASHSVDTTLS